MWGKEIKHDKIQKHVMKQGRNHNHVMMSNVATPLLEECEDDTHTPKIGTWESSETLETLEFDCKGQNTSP
jgi:hypothetical protein